MSPAEAPVPVARVTVPLIAKAFLDLEALTRRSGLGQADVINRALSFYEAVESEIAEGAVLLIRRADGSTYQVHRF